MDDGHIREICLSRVTTIEQLWKDHKKDKTSLGLIKPQLEKIIIKEKKFDKKAGNLKFQTKLEGEIIPIDILKYNVVYKFKCGDNCKGHTCRCLDTESGQLYRNIVKRDPTDPDVVLKMKDCMMIC